MTDAAPAPVSARDVAGLGRVIETETESTQHHLDVVDDRVERMEEIIAARWPRSWLLRRRLAREIRASVGIWDDDFIPRGDFHARRVESTMREAGERLERFDKRWRRHQAVADRTGDA